MVLDILETVKGKHGGARPGSGKPKGSKWPTTILKDSAKAELQEMILSQLKPIVRAGIKAATGVDHMMLRDEETGLFKKLTTEEEIAAALNAPNAKEGSTYWIHTLAPNIPALVTLLDRAIGKPVEEVQAEVKGGLTIRWKAREE